MRAKMKMAAIAKGAKLNKLRIHSMAKKMLKKEQNKGIFKEMMGRHDELLAKLTIKQETGSLILTQDSPNSFSCADTGLHANTSKRSSSPCSRITQSLVRASGKPSPELEEAMRTSLR